MPKVVRPNQRCPARAEDLNGSCQQLQYCRQTEYHITVWSFVSNIVARGGCRLKLEFLFEMPLECESRLSISVLRDGITARNQSSEISWRCPIPGYIQPARYIYIFLCFKPGIVRGNIQKCQLIAWKLPFKSCVS